MTITSHAADAPAREFGPRPGPDTDRISQILGASVTSVHPLATFRHSSSRQAFRLDLVDGRTVKLRQFANEDRAAAVHRLLAAAPSGDFSSVLARDNASLIESWAHGEPLDARPLDDSVIAAAGALLARLHTVAQFDDRRLPTTATTAAEREAFHRDIERLHDGNMLDAVTASSLVDAAAADDPGACDVGLTHNDFTADNIVMTSDQRLVAIDNEHLRIGALDGDLVRSMERWRLDTAGCQAFMRGYASLRNPRPALTHRRWWRLRSLAHSARVRYVENDRKTVAAHVRTMCEIARNETGARDGAVVP